VLCQKFKFHLALENSQCPDYITEKLLLTFTSNTVPIYWGAPNIGNPPANFSWVPHPHSYIDATKFENVTMLAKYVQLLSENDYLYNEYFEWRNKPLAQEYINFLDMPMETSLCRLCEYIAFDKKSAKLQV